MSKWTQFKEIFKRNIQYLLRNPRTLQATFFNAALIGFLIMALFHNIGNPPQTKTLQQKFFNWLGLSFLICNNVMFPTIMQVVL